MGRSPSFGLNFLSLCRRPVTGVTQEVGHEDLAQLRELELGRQVAVDFEADAHFDECRSCP
jgi:hypothetical protein